MEGRRRYTRQQRRRRAIIKRRIVVACMAVVLAILIFMVFKIFSFTSGDGSVESNQSEISDAGNSAESSSDISQEGIEGAGLTIEMLEPEMEPISITVSLTGDCTLGTDLDYGYEGSFMEMADVQNDSYFFQNVSNIFAADDLTIVNLEGPLTEGNQDADKTFAFRGEPSYTEILSSGNVEAANLANNHSYDYGTQGYEDTAKALENAGIIAYGYDKTQVVDVNGVQVGLVGMYELAEGIGIKSDMIDRIERVKEEGAQIVIVTFHWGTEREYYPEDIQKELSHTAIDNGADLVVGHHPHVLQGIEEYKGKYIAYSLGNFCFGGNKNPTDKDTIIYQQTFTVDETGVLLDSNINIIPCSISSTNSRNNFQPTPLEGDEKNRVVEKLQEISMTDITSFVSE